MATKNVPPPHPKSQATTRTCLCAPTTHPGSFRCSIHRNSRPHKVFTRPTVRLSSSQWELAAITKVNSLRAFLLHIIKPSSHDLQRRRNFQPKPSRFCVMNNNSHDHGVAVS
ncbi:hypothetical protein CJ030_MR0G003787 [Morella rubra]|uniref:Serine-rich protein-related n=1 Tax=Morella rubra TaxID=262757 RepID=A0A6A1UNQ3_9ROSI|nr:hypothetical protein CJ030_MR0G003787 [Morella rubra]